MGSSLPAALLVALGTLLGGPGPPLGRWSFEHGTDGWLSRDARLGRTGEQARDGGWSLRVDVAFPRPASLSRRAGFDVDLAGDLTYHVYVPDEAPEAIHTLVFLKDKDGLWFQHLFEEPLRPGGWNEVRLDISPSSPQLQPSGHHGAWGAAAAHQATEIGISFFCQDRFKGSLFLDGVEVARPAAARPPLRVVDLRESSPEVGRFEKLELTFSLTREVRNPFDPDEIQIDATFVDTAGMAKSVPAFHHQDFTHRLENGREELTPAGPAAWKVRFAPTTLGHHEYFLTVTHKPADGEPERLVTGRRAFTCVESKSRGFVRVSQADPAYFEFSNGEWFYPIGHNVHAPADASPRAEALQRAIGAEPLPDRGTFSYDELFAKMAANGENLAEVWMSAWWLGLEWNRDWRGYNGIGRYNLENAWRLDRLLALAEKHGLYLHLVVDNHGKCSTWCDPEWEDNPFNERNGGFLASPEDYFRSPLAREWHKKKLRYLVARWGYSTRVAGLELWSEIDLVGDSYDFYKKPEAVALKVQWHAEMSDYLAQLDPWNHLVTTHYSTDYRRIQPALLAVPGLRYATCDAYKLEDDGPILPIILNTAKTFRKLGKPGFVTEYGGKPVGDQSIPGLRADLHAGLWATYMTHTAGTPLLWWFQFIDSAGLYGEFRALAAYHRGEDRRGKGLEARDATFPVGHPDLDALCLQNAETAYAWVYSRSAMFRLPEPDKAPVFKGITLRLFGFQEGHYAVEAWDTAKGEAVATVRVHTSAGQLTIALPEFRTDCALKIKPAPPPTAGAL